MRYTLNVKKVDRVLMIRLMADESKDTEKLRKLVNLLPKENCGKCGYDNCGAFAVALVAGKASPFDCNGAIPNTKEICEILGIEVPEGAELLAVEHGRGHGGGHGHHKHGSHHGGNGHGKGDHHHAGSHHTR